MTGKTGVLITGILKPPLSKTSTFVGMERSALHRKLKTLNIHAANNKASDEKDDLIFGDAEKLVEMEM